MVVIKYWRSRGIGLRVDQREMTAEMAIVNSLKKLDRGRQTLRDIEESKAWSAISLAISALEGSDD